MAQHGDPPAKLTQRAYTNFLVDSPLRHVARAEDASAPACGYGSFQSRSRQASSRAPSAWGTPGPCSAPRIPASS